MDEDGKLSRKEKRSMYIQLGLAAIVAGLGGYIMSEVHKTSGDYSLFAYTNVPAEVVSAKFEPDATIPGNIIFTKYDENCHMEIAFDLNGKEVHATLRDMTVQHLLSGKYTSSETLCETLKPGDTVHIQKMWGTLDNMFTDADLVSK